MRSSFTSLFKDPDMGWLVRLGSEPRTSRSATHCSPICVNRTALIYFVSLQESLISPWTCLLLSSSTLGFTPSTERNISKHYLIDSVLEARTNVTRKKQGHPTSVFGKYLFGRRFEIYNFQNICCKISCLPASPKIFEHLKNGIIAYF